MPEELPTNREVFNWNSFLQSDSYSLWSIDCNPNTLHVGVSQRERESKMEVLHVACLNTVEENRWGRGIEKTLERKRWDASRKLTYGSFVRKVFSFIWRKKFFRVKYFTLFCQPNTIKWIKYFTVKCLTLK